MEIIQRILSTFRLKAVKVGPFTLEREPTKLRSPVRERVAEPRLSEDAIRAADTNDIIFREVEVTLSDSWDEFSEWLASRLPDCSILSISEDHDMESSFYYSGKPGHLTWPICVSGTKGNTPFTQRYDLIRDWLHPLALKLSPSDAGLPWDTSLFPVKHSDGCELMIQSANVELRDGIYWVLFASLK